MKRRSKSKGKHGSGPRGGQGEDNGENKTDKVKEKKKNIDQEDSIKVRQGEKTKGGFLKSMLAKGKQFFEEDEN